MLPANLAVKGVVLSTSAAILLQTTNLPVNDVGKYTLDGVLVMAVVALWRALSKKDDQLVSTTAAVTKALAVNSAALSRNTDAVEGLQDKFDEHNSRLPCTHIQIEPAKKPKH